MSQHFSEDWVNFLFFFNLAAFSNGSVVAVQPDYRLTQMQLERVTTGHRNVVIHCNSRSDYWLIGFLITKFCCFLIVLFNRKQKLQVNPGKTWLHLVRQEIISNKTKTKALMYSSTMDSTQSVSLHLSHIWQNMVELFSCVCNAYEFKNGKLKT